MDNQPNPSNYVGRAEDRPVSCETCQFSKRGPVDPSTLKSQLFCREGPPVLMTAPTQQGVVIVGCSAIPVNDDTWCWRFKLARFPDLTRSKFPPTVRELTLVRESEKILDS